MRIWDIEPSRLCRAHLLGEHAELHAIWSILVNDKTGYARHPETLRWRGKLKALYLKHDEIAAEMARRDYAHRSDLPEHLATGSSVQDDFVDSPEAQVRILRAKGCDCRV